MALPRCPNFNPSSVTVDDRHQPMIGTIPHGILNFLSVPIGVHPWFKKDLGFKAAILKGFKAI